jgi:iron-sulfur cluster assembly protein
MSNNYPRGNESIASVPADWTLGRAAAAPSGDDGAALEVVKLTESARVEVKRLLAEEGTAGLRLGIKGGGCSGLSYLLEFTDEREGDTIMEVDDFKVFLDRKSTIYLSGITLDFQSGLNGRGFVFDNPQASNTCGCGESFSL